MMWKYGTVVPEVTALHRAVRGTGNQLDCITSTISASDIPATVRCAHVHPSSTPQSTGPITWRSPVLIDMNTQRNHKFKLKRQLLEMQGQVLYLGKQPTMMAPFLHLDDVTAVEPSCLEPHSLLIVTTSLYILIALADERDLARWRALLRHARPLGDVGTLQIKTHDDTPTLETTLRTDWSVAECMAHMGLDEDKFCINVNGTSQYWTDPSACLEDFASPGTSLLLTAVPQAAPVKSTSSLSANALNVRFHKICNVFQHIVDVKGGQRHLTDRLESSTCVLRLEVTEGSHVHCTVDTAPFSLMPDSSRHLDNVWYTLWNVPAATVSSSWRLVCTAFAVTMQPEDEEPDASMWTKLASTGMQLRRVDGALVDGHSHLQLLDSTADLQHGPLPLGVVHGAPYLHVECAWQDLDFSRRPSQQLSASMNDPTIMKQGLVSILQSGGGSSSRGKRGAGLWTTQWTPKWCVITSHGQVVLSPPPADANQVTSSTTNTMTFSLTSASSLHAADKLNSTSRRSSHAGSNSTRKVYTTYAFTIDVDAVTTLVVGAATRHARDDWLHTLRVATSSVASRKSIDMNWSFRGTSLSDDATASDDSATNSNNSNSIGSSLPWLLEHMAQDPLFELSSYQRSLLWQHRQSLPKSLVVLPRLLTCREWILPAYHDDLAELLESTLPPTHPTEFIGLLGRSLAHLPTVREFAIDKLDAALDDATLATVLPQLVQCMKWEPYAASRLVSWVFTRAMDAPLVLGVPLFWALHVETFVPHYTQRFQLLEQAYLMAAGRSMRRMLVNQLELCRELHRLARDMQTAVVSSSGGSTLDAQLRARLCALNVAFAGRLSLPLHTDCTLVEFATAECRVLKSTKRPLWLTLETAGRKKVSVIFKAGDDVRQDMVTLQLFGLMQQLWHGANIPTQLQLYGCIATSPTSGIVEVVGDAVTTAAIHKEGGVLGPMQEMRFAKWIEAQNESPKHHMQALDMFRRSAAGYCVATHVLGIGDRHNDNIMMTRKGQYFHIDFGHFLGHCKYHMNFKRDQTPFVFTKEMAFALGGTDSPFYATFVSLCGRALNELRQHVHLITTWLALMLPANMVELQDTHDIYHVVEALVVDLTPTQAAADFEGKIQACLGDPYKRIDNTIHNLVHLLRP